MVKIILVSKNGELEETNYKHNDADKLYKSAGFKNNNGFKCYVKWKVESNNKTHSYLVYGKELGKPGYENKYEFPPPIDNLLLFNNCVIIKRKNKKLYEKNLEEWLFVYEKLYGGFEDIDDEDDFQNIDIDKYVDIHKIVPFECKYSRKFKRWYPLQQVDEHNKIVHIGKLVKNYINL